MENPKRARRRKPDTAKTDLEPPHRGVQLGCTRDEGRPLGLGLQDRGPNHRKLLRHNGRGVSPTPRASTARTCAGSSTSPCSPPT